jgi:hypothetical protein
VADPDLENFFELAELDLRRIIQQVNMHSRNHRSALGQSTCLRPDGTCRFHFERPIVPQITIKDGLLLNQRLDGWVNAWNHILSVCLRCNLDIRLILSGRDCKAVVLYICNYITKKMDRNYNFGAVMEAALRSLEEEENHKGSINDVVERSRKLLIKCVNKANAQVEKSAPEVAAFLLGSPTAYCSHKFSPLYFVSVLRFADKQFALLSEHQLLEGKQDVGLDGLDDFLLETEADGQQSLGSALADYLWRADEDGDLSLYEYAAQGRRVRFATDASVCSGPESKADLEHKGDRCFADEAQRTCAGHPDDDDVTDTEGVTSRRPFLPGHPQAQTHHHQPFQQPRIPVIIGPAWPSRQANPERFATFACLLFVPWRSIEQLVRHNRRLLSWSEAFDRLQLQMSPEMRQKLRNVESLHEGRSQVQAERAARQGEQQQQQDEAQQADSRFEVKEVVAGLMDVDADELPDLEHDDAVVPRPPLTVNDIVIVSNAEKAWTEQGLRFALQGGACNAVSIGDQVRTLLICRRLMSHLALFQEMLLLLLV